LDKKLSTGKSRLMRKISALTGRAIRPVSLINVA
jgi:hypothetical protein